MMKFFIFLISAFAVPFWLGTENGGCCRPAERVGEEISVSADGARKDHGRNALTKVEAEELAARLYGACVDSLKEALRGEWTSGVMSHGSYRMPFAYTVYGDRPADGRSLYISLHGGGGAPAEVNDGQWENQKRLYAPEEGVYLSPRAAVDAWNMWHQEHVDAFLEKLIQASVLFKDVNPDKVYVLGYSAGGDGVFQLAPRLADHWAAASMMAGHPGDAAPDNLRNIWFSIWVGEHDAAYDRNKHAVEWGNILDSCSRGGGYPHEVHLVKGKGHWMELEETPAIARMALCRRNPYPDTVAWRQDDVLRPAFYWLSVPEGEAVAGRTAVVSRKGNRLYVHRNDYGRLDIWLNDRMLDLDRPVEVFVEGRRIFRGRIARTREAVAASVQRLDKSYIFTARLSVEGKKVVLSGEGGRL